MLAKYLAEVIQKGLSNIKDNGKDINSQIDLCNRLIDTVVSETGEQALGELSVDKRAEMLLALIDKQNTIHAVDAKADIVRPITSIRRIGANHRTYLVIEH